MSAPESTARVAELAAEAASYFETAERQVERTLEFYVRLRDPNEDATGAPDWLQDAVYAAHAGRLPDDWRYETIREAFQHIADYGADITDDEQDDIAHEFADGGVDVTGELLAWLASHPERVGYCDEYARDMGAPGQNLIERISGGQYLERLEVFRSVLGSLQEQAA